MGTPLTMIEHFHSMQRAHNLKCQMDKIMKSSLIYLHVNHVSVPGSLEDSCRMRCILKRHLSFSGQYKGYFSVKKIITTDSRHQIVTYSDEHNTACQCQLEFYPLILFPRLRKIFVISLYILIFNLFMYTHMWLNIFFPIFRNSYWDFKEIKTVIYISPKQSHKFINSFCWTSWEIGC